MKFVNYKIIVSLLCIAFCINACEKAAIQKSTTSTAPINDRDPCPIEDCEDCPVNDCCCAVELVSGIAVELHFCGTSSECVSDQSCFVEDLDPNCTDISGFLEYIALDPTSNPRALFCVPVNSPFGIVSTNPSNSTSTIRINCRLDQIPSQWDTIQLNTPPDKPYWETGSDCSLTPCL